MVIGCFQLFERKISKRIPSQKYWSELRSEQSKNAGLLSAINIATANLKQDPAYLWGSRIIENNQTPYNHC